MSAVIALAGCGKMGCAMLRGWLDSNLVKEIHTFDPNGLPTEFQSNAKITHHQNANNFSKTLLSSDFFVIAVKPQDVEKLVLSIRGNADFDLTVLSIAAGKTTQTIQHYFSSKQPIIRAMPNLPAAIGKGMTVACASEQVTKEKIKIANTLLSTLGHIEWVKDENLMDAVTAVSGSGPAYLFYLIECMAAAGEKAGLPPDLAMKLARQTVIGAASLAEHEKDLPAKTLRENVTSPNGTTAAALSVLMDGRFQTLMNESINLAIEKSKLLSKK